MGAFSSARRTHSTGRHVERGGWAGRENQVVSSSCWCLLGKRFGATELVFLNTKAVWQQVLARGSTPRDRCSRDNKSK